MNNSRFSLAVGVTITIWSFVLMCNFAFAQINFRTDLVGESEVPPLFSESYGSALVVGNDSGVNYQINVTSLDKVTGVFLYKGDTSENGQVLVTLLNSTEPSGVIDGKLVEGTIDSSSISAPLANLTINVTLADPIPGNLTNATSAVSTGNLTNATSAAAPPSKLEALIHLMNQNMTYINIHTSDFPEGELRGTLTSTNSSG
ncbi:MAG TPA: CHRD domain-containing protein [Nitrososphaeraceae archaeon]|nr:CHRD domain-containing protein [Nitrososphaeraceae archaeon]